jgi:hypothetical protein
VEGPELGNGCLKNKSKKQKKKKRRPLSDALATFWKTELSRHLGTTEKMTSLTPSWL